MAWAKGLIGLVAALMLATPAGSAPGESDIGMTVEQNRPAAWHLEQHRKLAAAIAALKPQRPGVVDAYVIAIGLDADPVFGREAAEAARVLSRRYDAVGRTVLLSVGPGAANPAVPSGTPGHLATTIAAVAGKMDLKEDALILFTTSHGSPVNGLNYQDGLYGYGMIGPKRLASLIDGVGIKRRMVVISACFSGIFVPVLASESSLIVTAASDSTASFGCGANNDWTYFGDAFINTALRKPQATEAAAKEAFALIAGWEKKDTLMPSLPQLSVGPQVKDWLVPLEARMPKVATPRVGVSPAGG